MVQISGGPLSARAAPPEHRLRERHVGREEQRMANFPVRGGDAVTAVRTRD